MVDKKAGNFNKSIFDIRVIDVYLTSTPSSAWVLDTGSIANIGNSKQKLRNKQRLAKGEVTMCVGSVSKVDVITSPLASLRLFRSFCFVLPILETGTTDKAKIG